VYKGCGRRQGLERARSPTVQPSINPSLMIRTGRTDSIIRRCQKLPNFH
jgi:hypothetical protein